MISSLAALRLFPAAQDPTTFMGVPERASIRVEDELVAVYATCVYIACKATDRVGTFPCSGMLGA